MEQSNRPGGGYSGSRRDFIKIAAASLGGTLLAGGGIGCAGDGFNPNGGGGGGLNTHVGLGTMPNGYTFYRLFTPGRDSVLGDVQMLMGGVLNNDSTILFYARKRSGAMGLYQISVEYGGDGPRIVDIPTVIMEQGQVLPGGIPISTIGSASLSNEGPYSTCAAIVTGTADHGRGVELRGTPCLWTNPDGDFAPLVVPNSPTPDGGRFGAHLTDVSINKNGDILLVAEYSREDEDRIRLPQGVFKLSGSGTSSQGQLLGKTGSLLQGSGNGPSRFGICDYDSNGNFVVQGFSQNSLGANAKGVSARIFGAANHGSPRLLSGPPGTALMGPRIDNGTHTAVMHVEGSHTDHALYYNNNLVTRTGASSPTGSRIIGIGPGSVSNDITHFLITVENGMELVVSNGSDQRTVLKYGDRLANSPQQIRGIVHGFHADQADSGGNIVFIGEFEDGSQSVVVGMPH
ncbi:hypothetical protein EON81_06555 [bacterium]|nr:MAG: hypothetical protein EON81_06555 [bacterium]